MTAIIDRPTKKVALIERLNVGTAFLFGFLGAVVTYVDRKSTRLNSSH